MKEPESAGNNLAFLKSFLSSIAALLCNVFNARGSTIVVMVKLMQRAEVSSKTQRKLASILDNILTRSRLCNTAEACCGWAYAWRLYVVCIFNYDLPPPPTTGKAFGVASPSALCIPTSSNTFLAPRF